MKRFTAPVGVVLFLLVLILSACNFPSRDNPPISAEQALHTAAARTVEAIAITRAAELTASPFGTVTPTPPLTLPGSASATAAVTADSACDQARFVEDVSVPDNSAYAPGTAFTKTWRLRNAGTCTWTTAYRVIFDSGDSMSAPVGMNLPHTVLPGDTVDISVPMIAPLEQRNYTGYWMLENADRARFGTGDGNKAFWVKIVVGTTPVPFAVTAARTIPENSNITAACPYNYTFNVQISTTTGGRVTYFLERSDGRKTRTRDVEFREAGTQTVSVSWEFTESFTGSVRTYIDEPNHQYFQPVNITLSCY